MAETVKSNSELLQSMHELLLTSKSKENVANTSTEAHPPPGGSQTNLYGCPASLIATDLKISNFDLADSNILLCSVSSAGISLPLPLDTCYSVSLVS